MRKQIIVNINPNEIRVSLLENGILAEVHIERSSEEVAAGNVYKGRVSRVLPGMQAAFIELGLEKAAFLHTSDITPEQAADGDLDLESDSPPQRQRRDYGPIEKKIKKGDELIVQISKEPMGTKGARITSYLSLPGRYAVYLPGSPQVGVSKRIGNDKERRKLRDAVNEVRPADAGVIVRTSAQTIRPADVAKDVKRLANQWDEIKRKAKKTRAPALLHSDLDLVLRCVRDMLSNEIDEIAVDSEPESRRIQEFVSSFMPDLAARVEYFDQLVPIFDHYGVEGQISRATEAKVWLKSGGYLVIDQGEALTMVHVNTGKFVGR